MTNSQKKYTAFLESVCNKFSCPEAIPALKEGFRAFCEAAFCEGTGQAYQRYTADNLVDNLENVMNKKGYIVDTNPNQYPDSDNDTPLQYYQHSKHSQLNANPKYLPGKFRKSLLNLGQYICDNVPSGVEAWVDMTSIPGCVNIKESKETALNKGYAYERTILTIIPNTPDGNISSYDIKQTGIKVVGKTPDDRDLTPVVLGKFDSVNDALPTIRQWIQKYESDDIALIQ